MHAEFRKKKRGSVSPFSKLAAAAISKISERLQFGHLLNDFDELLYAH
jgi:hypothetical protein